VTGSLLAVEGEPLAITALPAAIAGTGMLLALTAAWLRPSGSGRVHVAAGVLGGAVRDAISHLRSFDARLAGALAWWSFDMFVLWAMLNAFGAPPALAIVVLAYFLGQVGNTIPIPGAVSGGLVGALLAFGVEADLAIVSVLAYRAIAIWLPAPIGLVALGKLRGTMAAWGREDGVAGPAPAYEGLEVVTVAPSLPGATRPAWRPLETPCHAAA
jgi:uncharacterized membrane protein YbhN (UPF0104 family)